MNRRAFTKTFALSTLAIGVGGVPSIARKPATQFSITMDDFYWQPSNKLRRNATSRSSTPSNKHSIKAAAFVIGRNIEDQEGKDLIAAWDKAGHLIANHTYSHREFNAPETDVKAYQEDILRAEALLKEFPVFASTSGFPC